MSHHAINPVVFVPSDSYSTLVQGEGEDDSISITNKEAANEAFSAHEKGEDPCIGGDKILNGRDCWASKK